MWVSNLDDRPEAVKVLQSTEEYCPLEYESYGFYHGKPATVWSLGVLMFTLVCGEFPSSDDLDMLNDNIWTRDGVSQECCKLLCSLLQRNPAKWLDLDVFTSGLSTLCLLGENSSQSHITGISIHLKRLVEVRLHQYRSTCQYPDCKSNVLNQATQNLGTRTTGDDHGEKDGSMMRRHYSRRGRGHRHEEQGQPNRERAVEQKAEDSVPRGTCMTMCPAYELHQRKAHNRLHRFEMLAGTERDHSPCADVSRAVKEYSRPAADKEFTRACNLRPPSVLLKTVCYLVDDIAASSTFQPWTEVYSFVSDRLRSVQQDMIIQRVSGPDCVAVLEKSVRFLLYASYRLCGQPLQYYDPRINDTHLQESLSWLLENYRNGKHWHQEEFQALSLLYNLGLTHALQHVLELPEGIRSSPAVQLALAINRAHSERNPVRLLRLAQRLDFIQGPSIHRHLLPCRRDLLLLYSHGHSSPNCRFPLPRLARFLSLSKTSWRPGARRHRQWRVDLQCRRMHEPVDDEQWNCHTGGVIHDCA
ncbi:serine/threonine-protein kinase pim-1-like [Pimephales promelas]|nr:serine/threonine-protein kinase pim-1-like [Pimephales promelas]